MKGQLTYNAEGQEGGSFHSRKLHVPSNRSGLTIGRGYDLRDKASVKIFHDLSRAKIEPDMAQLLCQARGLTGKDAKQFIIDRGLDDFEITMEQQLRLFDAIYSEMEKDVIRICNKRDCMEAYGKVDWGNLHPKLKDIVIDLRYRGDYTSKTRKLVQPCLVANSILKMRIVLEKTIFWRVNQRVPKDRHKRRVEYLQ